MAKPPAGSSLLFGALADSGRIKQRKNGSYRMVLKGIDEIDWFTDRPDRFEGLWKPQKLIRKWDAFFASSEPNAQASFKVGKERELITFEMFKPKYNDNKQQLSFRLNAGIINKRESDIVTGIKNQILGEVTLFIDDATLQADTTIQAGNRPSCFPNCQLEDLSGANLSDANLYGADLETSRLEGANLSNVNLFQVKLAYSDLTSANLANADLTDADLTGSILESANLSHANLTGANLRDADFESANFENARLCKANLNGAILTQANLTGANLTDTDLTNAFLPETNNAKFWGNTICPDGTLNLGISPCTSEQLNVA